MIIWPRDSMTNCIPGRSQLLLAAYKLATIDYNPIKVPDVQLK